MNACITFDAPAALPLSAPKPARSRDAFEVYLAKIRAATQRKIDKIGNVSNGAVLVHADGKRWAFLLPDMTEEGKWRIQRFDLNGFSGHGIYDTHDQLVEAAAGEGFYTHDPEALDRVQNLPSFHRGNYWSDLIRRVNAREITFAEADRLLAEYETTPA